VASPLALVAIPLAPLKTPPEPLGKVVMADPVQWEAPYKDRVIVKPEVDTGLEPASASWTAG
jgi:hypothetical protein